PDSENRLTGIVLARIRPLSVVRKSRSKEGLDAHIVAVVTELKAGIDGAAGSVRPESPEIEVAYIRLAAPWIDVKHAFVARDVRVPDACHNPEDRVLANIRARSAGGRGWIRVRHNSLMRTGPLRSFESHAFGDNRVAY